MEETQKVMRLSDLARRLFDETRDLAEAESDLQLWYNRGYANGMFRALEDLGLADALSGQVEPDDPARMAEQAFLPWGKAWRHGFEMGERETREVL